MRRLSTLVIGALVAGCQQAPGASAPLASGTPTASASQTALRQSGSLDQGFGAAGIVVTPVGAGDDIANAAVLQPDGRIIAVGLTSNGADYDMLLVRYNADGSLDSGFGAGGKVTTPVGPANDWAWDGALQPDGKIITAGFASNGTDFDVALVRYNSDGRST